MELIWYFMSVVISALSFITGVWLYYHRIYSSNYAHFRGKTRSQAFLALFSHVDSVHTGPAPHIISGVLTLAGGVGLISLAVLRFLIPSKFDAAMTLSLFSAIAVLFFAAIEIWTLWQAKRIAFDKGYIVSDFKTLIRQLTEELKLMEQSIRIDYELQPERQIHRFYAVAPHFFFGMLSFPRERITRDYRNALVDLCEVRGACTESFPIDIICSDDASIHEWHMKYFRLSRDKDAKIKSADETFNALLNDMDREARRPDETDYSIFSRMEDVPKVQFMIIGNKLFEFTMNSANNSTNIFNTQVVSDARLCDAYIEQYKFIKNLALKKKEHSTETSIAPSGTLKATENCFSA